MSNFAKLFEPKKRRQVLITVLDKTIHIVTVINDITYTSTICNVSKLSARSVFNDYSDLDALKFVEGIEETFNFKN